MTKERKDEMEQEKMRQEAEEKEIYEQIKDRLDTPKDAFIKYESHEQFFELIMEDKKKKGWKFKDEK